MILEYKGSTRIATLNRDWKIAPDATTEYVILASAGGLHVNEGLAQGGGPSTITLNSLASATDDLYNGQFVFPVSGPGQDQVARVTAYNGTTKVATIETTMDGWATEPTNATGYIMVPILDIVPTILGTPSGASVSADIAENQADLNTIITVTGATANVVIATQITVDGLQDISAADVLAQAKAAIVFYNMDHFALTPVANNADMTAEVADGTVFSNMMSSSSNTSTYTVADDSLQGISEGGGAGLSQQQVRDAMKLAASAGAFADNSVDDYLVDILAQALLIGGSTYTVSSPVAADGAITITQGDDWPVGNEFTFTVTGYTGPSLVSGAAVSLRLEPTAGYNLGTGTNDLTVAGTISQSGTTVTSLFVLTAAQTAALDPAPPDGRYNYTYQHVATDTNSKIITLGLGPCEILRSVAT